MYYWDMKAISYRYIFAEPKTGADKEWGFFPVRIEQEPRGLPGLATAELMIPVKEAHRGSGRYFLVSA